MSALRPPRPAARPVRRQRGFMLIEALIAILIFSIGILGIIGLQASAVQQSTDAKNRAEAAYLADQLMGQMWSGDRTVANLRATYKDCGTACSGWYAWYNTVKAVLPGVSDTTDTRPKVAIDDDGIVTINVFWRAVNDDASQAPHRFDIQAQIGQ
jgi:type IV pilus assembly protein PilV